MMKMGLEEQTDRQIDTVRCMERFYLTAVAPAEYSELQTQCWRLPEKAQPVNGSELWLILAINTTKAIIICKINSLPWLLDK